MVNRSTIAALLIATILIGGARMISAQSQAAMTQDAVAEAKAAEKEMNEVYQAVIEAHSENEAFLERLRTAQKAWLQFRKLHLESYYPAGSATGGSVTPMCVAIQSQTLTEQRTEQLRYFIEAEEGDVCVPNTEEE